MYETATTPLRPRRPGRTLAIVLAVTVAACCAAGGTSVLVRGALDQAAKDQAASGPAVGDGATGSDGPAGSGQVGPAAGPGLNTPVRDGKFEFVVTSVTCGHTEIVNGWLRAQAQGQYCLATMTVANIGTEPRHFADGAQKARGPQGHVYAADTGAGVVANGDGSAVWNVVNPGNSISATVVFDLPPGATVTELELHDSGWSGGVTVRVDA